ncbi:hypothetical protein [Prochlorococcus marinus]|uniref:hypothetical protein n=1 Tax=Prochlorococcus marinus TaxID=1219 RepID=UPI0022B32181|nr:hypothetical protein [Prochlorococcus marinus]
MNKITNLKTKSNLLEIAITYWIKSKCKSIQNLKVNLAGISLSLFNYQFSSIDLNAENIIFKNLDFKSIKLIAEDVSLKLNLMAVNNNKIKIKKEFNITSEIVLASNHLQKIILKNEFSWLQTWMKSKFLLLPKLTSINICNNLIKIQSESKPETNSQENLFDLKTKQGKLIIKEIKSSREEYLPMDKSIFFNKVFLKNQLLTVKISSTVKP